MVLNYSHNDSFVVGGDDDDGVFVCVCVCVSHTMCVVSEDNFMKHFVFPPLCGFGRNNSSVQLCSKDLSGLIHLSGHILTLG